MHLILNYKREKKTIIRVSKLNFIFKTNKLNLLRGMKCVNSLFIWQCSPSPVVTLTD